MKNAKIMFSKAWAKIALFCIFFRFLSDIGELQSNFLEHPETNFALSTLAANKNGISPINKSG